MPLCSEQNPCHAMCASIIGPRSPAVNPSTVMLNGGGKLLRWRNKPDGILLEIFYFRRYSYPGLNPVKELKLIRMFIASC